MRLKRLIFAELGLIFERLNCVDMMLVESLENVSVNVANLNLIMNEMKAMTRFIKKLYLFDLTSILDDLKFIEKLFQSSTTFLLMISSNSINFEGKLRFEVGNFGFKFFLSLRRSVLAKIKGR